MNDHIAEARKMVGRPQIREIFLRNGARIEPDRDDLPDWVYESAFELLELAAPAVQGEPVAWQVINTEYPKVEPATHNKYPDWAEGDPDLEIIPLYTAPQMPPVVQGEPVACVSEETYNSDGTSDIITKNLPIGTKLYAAPQPTEQQPELCKYQPCGCVICTCEHETQCQGCGANHCGTHPVGKFPGPAYQRSSADDSLTPVPDELFASEFNAWWAEHGQLCRSGGGDAFEAWRHLYPQLMSLQMLVVEQQPAPDVAALVEALEQIEQWVKRWCADGHPIAKFAGQALAVYRSQGGEV